MAKELPEELVIEILLRLPVLARLRFRCVCKSWCSLISNTLHLLVHRRDKTTKDYLLSMLSFQTLDVLKTLPVPFFEIDAKIAILASCNGVICLEVNRALGVVLWNPTTRETKIVPKSLPVPPGTGSNNNDRGFGFDAKTNDYKVVQITYLHYIDDDDEDECGHHLWRLIYQVEVYSLRSDSWRKIDANVPACIFNGIWNRLYTNGMFWWWAFDDFDTLVSFDMSNEVFLTTPLPDANLIGNLKACTKNVFVRDEYVALVVGIRNDCEGNLKHFDIWVLGEYGVKESWTKLLTVGPYPGIDRPLGFWKNGQVFLRTCEGQLVLYDPVSQDIKYLQLDGIPNTIQLTEYTESLVSIKGGDNFE